MSGSEVISPVSNDINLNEKTRLIAAVIIFLFCVAVIAGLCFYQYFRFAEYETMDISAIPFADTTEYSWELDNCYDSGAYYLLSGWIVRTGESIRTFSIDLVIKKEDGTAYVVPVEMTERKDVAEVLNGDNLSFDYSASGFSAAINSRYVHKGERVYILYCNNGRYELVDISVTF